jgi:uncharacterized repeat protein (TIGR03806 family)
LASALTLEIRIRQPLPIRKEGNMRSKLVAVLLAVTGLAVVGVVTALTLAQARALEREAPKKERKPFGIEKREQWTTSHVVGSPDPPDPYRLENVFPDLKCNEPLELSIIPGSDRWVVAERRGKIYTFANDPKNARKELLVDVGRTVYGVVMHPKFKENGYFYVSSVLTEEETPAGSRVSRFKVEKTDPPRADPKSETVLLTWPSGGHNGGCIRFGPDGYLYLGTGDGSGIADGHNTGQDISDLLASLIRIDVDHHDEGKAYRVPKDNPFVDFKGARPEVWAYGLRQPWKYSFDTATGDLWVGEVGQDLWESIYKIQKGGNYGWSVNEGSHPFRIDRKRGPTPILPPLVEHPHSEFRSLTGGYVYHSKRLPELEGAYVYGDYDTGRVWLLRHDGKKATDHHELARSRIRIVAWGQDHAGDVYALDFMGSGVYRLVASPPPPMDAPKFPRKLSETGLFTSTKNLKPAPGVIPYSVNAELWSDGAVKDRYLAIPGDGQIEYNTMTYPQPAPGSLPGWRFPNNTVLVKTFSLDLEPGKPQSRRRLETRLLHVQRYPGTEEVGDQVWYGYTYVWNDDQTDAELLDGKGLDRKYTILDPKAPEGKREQTWRFPSRTECTMCHTVTAKYALGVNTIQMNKDHDYGGVLANQLATLDHIGLFTKPLPEAPEKMNRLVDYRDKSQSLDKRARSYLHANCSHCHRKWGGGISDFQLLSTLELKDTGTINTRPGQGTFDLKDPRILVPGQPDRSLLQYRMEKLGLGRMPHIASNVVDAEGAELIKEWIKEMPGS